MYRSWLHGLPIYWYGCANQVLKIIVRDNSLGFFAVNIWQYVGNKMHLEFVSKMVVMSMNAYITFELSPLFSVMYVSMVLAILFAHYYEQLNCSVLIPSFRFLYRLVICTHSLWLVPPQGAANPTSFHLKVSIWIFTLMHTLNKWLWNVDDNGFVSPSRRFRKLRQEAFSFQFLIFSVGRWRETSPSANRKIPLRLQSAENWTQRMRKSTTKQTQPTRKASTGEKLFPSLLSSSNNNDNDSNNSTIMPLEWQVSCWYSFAAYLVIRQRN